MVGFYKHDTAAWRGGTASLTHEQYRVYHVIVEEMMVQEGPILPHERMLAGLANMSTRALRRALDDLVGLGKLIMLDGRIANDRAGRELTAIRINRENAGKGGRTTREHVSNGTRTVVEATTKDALTTGDATKKPNENKAGPQAPLDSDERPKREEKRREEKEAPNGACPKRKSVRTRYPNEFEEFWAAYPTDQLMSKKQAFEVWKRLDDEDRDAAIASVPGFRAHCAQNPDYRPVHANRYLSQRRFDGIVSLQSKQASQVFVEEGTAAWDAWRSYGLLTRNRDYPVSQRDVGGRMVRGWAFATEFPPALEAAE